jgi:hypothetical protein
VLPPGSRTANMVCLARQDYASKHVIALSKGCLPGPSRQPRATLSSWQRRRDSLRSMPTQFPLMCQRHCLGRYSLGRWQRWAVRLFLFNSGGDKACALQSFTFMIIKPAIVARFCLVWYAQGSFLPHTAGNNRTRKEYRR